MNITFHALTGLAVAAFLGTRQKERGAAPLFIRSDSPLLAAGFAAGLLLHGVLDLTPHAYPIRSGIDAVTGVALFLAALLVSHRRRWFLLGACFLGNIFPDLVDLGPAIMNKHFGWSLPVVKLFPWHWPQYSGSIYDGSHSAESLFYHLLVTGTSFYVLYRYREQTIRF